MKQISKKETAPKGKGLKVKSSEFQNFKPEHLFKGQQIKEKENEKRKKRCLQRH